jgi:hypothetical protein
MLENDIRHSLSTVLIQHRSQVQIDSIRSVGAGAEQVWLVDYHLEGKFATPVQFTFPFAQAVPLEDSLANFMDYGLKNWHRAHLPPGSAADAMGAGAHG